jgi:antitoxin FitA
MEATMSSITIPLPDDRLEALKEKAARLKVSPEELVRASLEQVLALPDDEFERAVEYVLKKNQELHRRLA